jgi:acyl-CoA synthetase (AMP-forming)/AMP-acid ligase II
VALLTTGWWPRELRAAAEAVEPDLVVTTPHLARGFADLAPVVSLPGPDGWHGSDRRRLPSASTSAPPARATAAQCSPTARSQPEQPTTDACGPDERRGENRVHRPGPGSVICFTTGGWGRPRPVAIEAHQRAGWLGGRPGPSGGHVLLGHDLTTSVGVRALLDSLTTGGCLQLTERWQPRRVIRRLRRGGLDRLAATGPQLNQLAAVARHAGQTHRWESLARIEACGGALHRSSALCLAARTGAQVAAGFTVTEAGGWATERCPVRAAAHHPLDVGAASGTLAVHIRHPDGTTARPGEVGDVCLGGDAMGRPLHDDPSPTGATTTTGDLGRLGPDGALHLLGRRADRFRCGGDDVVPALVELVLANHPGVADVAVVPRPDADLGAIPVAVVVPADPEAPPFLADLSARLVELPPAWRPRAQAVVDRLPLTASGQLHRRMLAYDEAAR